MSVSSSFRRYFHHDPRDPVIRDMELEYVAQDAVRHHPLIRHLFFLDEILCRQLPLYYTDENHGAVAISSRLLPYTEHRRRLLVPMSKAKGLFSPNKHGGVAENIEELIVDMLYTAATLQQTTQHQSLQDAEAYLAATLNRAVLDRSSAIHTIIAPVSGLYRDAAMEYASNNKDCEVFFSKYVEEDRAKARVVNAMLVAPSPEFVGRAPTNGAEFGLAITDPSALCIVSQ